MIARPFALEAVAACVAIALGACRVDPRAGMHFPPEAAPVSPKPPPPRPQVALPAQETPPAAKPQEIPPAPPAEPPKAPAPEPAKDASKDAPKDAAKETPPAATEGAKQAAPPTEADQVEEARSRDEIAFENDYLRMKERLIPGQLGRWLAIVDGRVLPSDDRGHPSPASSMADCLAIADGADAHPLHRFVFQVGEEGDVLYADTSRSARSAVGTALRTTLGISAGYDARTGELTWSRGSKSHRYTLDHECFPLVLSDPMQRQSMAAHVADSSGYGGFLVLESVNAVLLDGPRYEIPGRVLLKTGDGLQELRRMRVRVSIPELDVDVTVPAAAWPR